MHGATRAALAARPAPAADADPVALEAARGAVLRAVLLRVAAAGGDWADDGLTAAAVLACGQDW